jgi:hypothetical protein
MIEMNLDEQTKQLEGTVDQLLWDLSILDYRANELKLACEAGQADHHESSVIDLGRAEHGINEGE